jgi:hypothetical protein
VSCPLSDAVAPRSHCGRCQSCIERRGAVMRLELEGWDPIDGYAVDPFVGRRGAAGASDLLRALEMADRVDHDWLSVLSAAAAELPGDIVTNLEMAMRLARRRAQEVQHAVEARLVACARALRRGELPRDCLLVEALLAPYREAAAHGRPLLRRVGDVWEARFGRTPSVYLPHARGLEYLRVLVARPHRPVSALELREVLLGSLPRAATDLAMSADAEALGAYKQRLRDLKRRRSEAEDEGDAHELGRIDREVAAIESELGRALGLGGRPRPSGDAERARKAITNAIRSAIGLVGRHSADMAQHFGATIRTGRLLAYEPETDPSWET